MNEKKQKNQWAVLLVLAIAIPGLALAGTVSTLSVEGASLPISPHASGTPAAIPSGPLTEVSGPSLTPQTVQQAGQYGYTLTPAKGVSLTGQTMTVDVSVGSSAALGNYVDQIQNPASPMYHAFLSMNSLGSLFGTSVVQYASDVSYFTSSGLSVQPDPARMVIGVTGTVPEIDAAFHTQIAAFSEQYFSPGVWNPLFGNASANLNSTTNRTVYLSTGAAYLPSGMHVGSVAGLSTLFAQPEVLSAFPGLSPATTLPSLGFTTTVPTPDQVTSISPTQALGGGSATSCATQNYTWASLLGIDWQFLFPCTMPALTGALSLWDGQGTISSEVDQGQGVTIGIIDVGCPLTSDLEDFQNQTGVNVLSRLTVIGIDTPSEVFPNTNLSGCINNGFEYGWTLETSVDIEYAAAMAPQAHIDLISVGDSALTSFDSAYQFTAQYLATGSATELPAGSDVISLVGGGVSSMTGTAASSVTITSNSYGTGEELTAIFGTPVYLQLENEALDELAAIGVTNFFASGDGGPTTYPFPLQAGIPADAQGVTSVGGGMVTAEDEGAEFPSTGVSSNISGEPMVVAPATGVASYTYWAESLVYDFSPTETIDALPPGYVGGGFGQSSSQPQPWWQNALDTYSSGALIDPVISGSAAFNMTVYVEGAWQLAYGGTSFATPITAAEWALVEEQALAAFGTPKFGDINALLFEVHNAQQAGAVSTNPFVTMTNIGTGGYYEYNLFGPGTYFFEGLWAPSNLYGVYSLASQDEFPQDQNLPYWYATLNNSAGPGWNYLQGLGMPLASTLDELLIGQVPSTQRGLDNLALYVMEVQGSSLLPVTSLVAGSTYTLEVLSVGGTPDSGPFTLTTYSGGARSSGPLSGSTFTYTPNWLAQNPFTNGSEYGYFYLQFSGGGLFPPWTFQFFAVVQPVLASGTLTLGVETPLGLVTTGEAQIPMLQAGGLIPSETGGQALVTLNGVPIGGAAITQTAVNIPAGAVSDPTISPASDAPGSVVGNYLTAVSGIAGFWTDSGEEYINWIIGWVDSGYNYNDVVAPPIVPVSFTLQASYDGLTSNVVTVEAEPGSGYFDEQFALSGGQVAGNVEFYSMNYLNFLNVSDGSSPGMYENLSYAAGTTYTGTLAVNLTAPVTGPVVVSVTGAGQSTAMLTGCGGMAGYGEYFMLCGFDPANTFQLVWSDPVVFLPATLSASVAGPSVAGDDTFAFAGTSVPGAEGSLELTSPDGTTALASGLSGSYTLDTSTLLDGWYTVQYVETAPSLAPTTQSLTFYADNQAVALSALVVELRGQVENLTAEVAADSGTVASLNAQIATLNLELTNALAQVVALEASNGADSHQLATLQAQVTSLQATVAQLQSQLAAKKTPTPVAWYAAFPGGGAALVGLVLAVGVAGAGMGMVVARRRPGSNIPGPAPGQPSRTPPAPNSPTSLLVPAGTLSMRHLAESPSMLSGELQQ
jgi:subtilase family serine protease